MLIPLPHVTPPSLSFGKLPLIHQASVPEYCVQEAGLKGASLGNIRPMRPWTSHLVFSTLSVKWEQYVCIACGTVARITGDALWAGAPLLITLL